MECSVCQVRSQVGFCKNCERLLCEVCGIPCDRCKKLVCRTHRDTTPGGRNLCPECMEQRNARRAQKLAEHKAASEREKEKETSESFSFEALMADLGDAPTPASPGAAKKPNTAFADATDLLYDLVPPERPRRDEDDNLSTRVLAVSGAQPTPYWNISCRASLLALVMVLAMYFFSSTGGLSTWMVGLVVAVGIAGSGLGVLGALDRAASPSNRKLCAAGIVVGLLAVLLGAYWRQS